MKKNGEWYIVDDDSNTWGCPYCQIEWQFTTGTPKDNEAFYCPRCGKNLISIDCFDNFIN